MCSGLRVSQLFERWKLICFIDSPIGHHLQGRPTLHLFAIRHHRFFAPGHTSMCTLVGYYRTIPLVISFHLSITILKERMERRHEDQGQ